MNSGLAQDAVDAVGNAKNLDVFAIQNLLKENFIICHGLVKCKECHVLWNRDVNAASNIYKIAKNALNGLERPAYLSRGQPQ